MTGNGIGARLRAARERAGLTSLQAASKLHLEPRVIEALESEQFDVIGAAVYVRGHLRRYAELVGAPADELLALYAVRTQEQLAPDLTQVPKPLAAAAPQRLAGPFVAAIVACAIIAGIWLALKGLPPAPRVADTSPSSAPSATPPDAGATAVSAPPVLTESTPAPASDAPANTVATDAADADANAQNTAATQPGVVAATPAAPTAPTTDPAAAPPPRGAPTRLRLAFREDSWVEVYDARGQQLFYDIGTTANEVTVSGRGPLRVLIGNVDGVTALEIDGRATTVPPEVRRGDTALFVVTRAGGVAPAR